MLIVFLILIVAFILTLIWMRENINFYRDLYKVEKEENDRLLKENQKQCRTINQNWTSLISVAIRAIRTALQTEENTKGNMDMTKKSKLAKKKKQSSRQLSEQPSTARKLHWEKAVNPNLNPKPRTKRKKDNIDLICEELMKYNEQHGTSYSYGEYTALVGMGKIKSKYRNERDIELPLL